MIFVILFGFALWPGFETIILSSFIMLMIPLLLTIISVFKLREEKSYCKRLLLQISIPLIIVVFFNITSNLQRIKIVCRDSPELIKAYSDLEKERSQSNMAKFNDERLKYIRD